MVADQIDGFHPKAVFWKENDDRCFAIVGSSNLTQAAFKSNYEANVFLPLSQLDYAKAKKWVRNIEKHSVVVSEDWLTKYKEARFGSQYGGKRSNDATPVLALKLPTPSGMEKQIEKRRADLAVYKRKRAGLLRLL